MEFPLLSNGNADQNQQEPGTSKHNALQDSDLECRSRIEFLAAFSFLSFNNCKSFPVPSFSSAYLSLVSFHRRSSTGDRKIEEDVLKQVVVEGNTRIATALPI
jgi:hypothetical protein